MTALRTHHEVTAIVCKRDQATRRFGATRLRTAPGSIELSAGCRADPARRNHAASRAVQHSWRCPGDPGRQQKLNDSMQRCPGGCARGEVRS
jgi:hypothetical protein